MGASSPNRLQPDSPLSDNLALINDNFDKTVQDIGDLGAKFTGVGLSSLTIAATSGESISVGIIDSTNQYVAGMTEVVPRLEVRVDVDDTLYTLPNGSSLSAAQQNADAFVRVGRTSNPIFIGIFYVSIRNYDVGPHTYYLHYDISYKASPPTGNFR